MTLDMTRSAVPAPGAVRRRKRRRSFSVMTVLAAAYLLIVLFFAIFSSLTPYDPGAISSGQSLAGPSAQHLFGTDQLGRDILSRVLAGARTSLLGPTILAAGITVIATFLAIVAGYFGGRTDAIISRIVDILYSVPALVVAIVVVGVTGGGFAVTLVILIVFGLPLSVRNLRAAVLDRVHLPYIEAAKTLGLPTWRTLVQHLLPTIAPFIAACFFLTFTYGVVELSSLSFLGLGVPPGEPDWGRMVADNRASLFGNFWGVALPAAALVLLAVSANIIGEDLANRYEKAGTKK